VADPLEHQRPQLQHRAAIIEAPPRCAPAQSGQAGHQQLISDQLAQRGLRREHARLVGAVGVACFNEGLVRWLTPDADADADAGTPLRAEIDAAFDELRALTT